MLRFRKTAWLLRRGLAPALALGAMAPAAHGVEIADSVAEVATSDSTLESVLVSSRSEASSDQNPSAPTLEPISQVSEYEPELADPPTRRAANKNKTPRVASRTNANVRETVDAAYRDQSAPRPARFHGVQPGVTPRAKLVKLWGEPEAVADTPQGDALLYKLEPFERVEALVDDGLVRVVRVSFADRATVDDMADRLSLDSIDPVNIVDPKTADLMAVVYPEKGLTLLTEAPLSPGAEKVTHLVLEPLDTNAFAMRAENRPVQEMERKLEDLRRSVELDPENAHAHWLAAGARHAAGQSERAERAAKRALDLASDNAAYRLRWAKTLAAVGRYDDAVLETRRVLDDASAPEVVRAQALHEMGSLASLGEASVAEKAIGFHNMAIEIADRLATSDDTPERRVAKDVLIEAHLSVALEIARGDFPKKDLVVADWIGRASGLAEERIESDGGGVELRLRVARMALESLAHLRPTRDPAPWIREAQEAADQLLDESSDPLFRASVAWELGEAYLHAVRVEHVRGEGEQALSHGDLAIEHLTSGAEPRAASPEAGTQVGRLYFYLGAVNAVILKDHVEAVGWYDRARPILTAERAECELVAPRREGERLVSMAVSYWKQDQRDLAIELTVAGADLMRRGVDKGVLKKSDLKVPYGNLASMHDRSGNVEKSAKYAGLFRSVGGTGFKPSGADRIAKSTKKTTKKQQQVASNEAKSSGGGAVKSSPVKSSGRRFARRPTARGTLTR